MYLEMLQQMYGAELEKQAMEKQALNPMQLIQMGRRFAARGKMDRFGQLIAKRNNAIKNTNVFATRRRLEADLHRKAVQEYKWLDHINGPVAKSWARALDRTAAFYGTKDLHRLLKQRPNLFKGLIKEVKPAQDVSPAVLADWSYKLHRMGM